MIIKPLSVLKKYSVFVSVFYTALLAALSLLRVHKVASRFPDNSDKLFHALAYALFTALWFSVFYYKLELKKMQAIALALILSIAFGGLIEVLQGELTQNRQFEYYDIAANSIGTIIAAIALMGVKTHVKKY